MIGHVMFGVFILILLYLVLTNGKAADSILTSSASAATGYTKTLQGR